MEPGDHDGDHTDDPASELAALVAAFSAALARHARAGAWGTSAAQTSRTSLAPVVASAIAAERTAPAARVAEAPHAERDAPVGVATARPSGGFVAPAAASLGPPLEDSLARFDEVPLPAEESMPVDDEFGFDSGARSQPARADRAPRSAPAARHAQNAQNAQPPRNSQTTQAPGDDGLVFSRGRKTLAMVREELGDCQRCKLSRTRGKLVFGSGAEDASLVFIGEAPGADEDRTGEPFVGRAGELLDKMIEAMGWSRRSVYVANLLKCRPPQNRNPEPDEARECRPFLIAQLEVIAPRIIVALGRPSANALLGTDAPISTLRGKFHERWGLRIMPTFHPAYLLREPAKKREAWSDLKLVMQELERIGVPPRA